MKSPILLAAALLVAGAFAATAADAQTKKELTPQQQRMADCAHKSKGMKGEEHKKFMSDCLKGKEEAPAGGKMTQQERMKMCNAEAGKKKLAKAERSKFMSECLKGEPVAMGGSGGAMEGKKTPQERMKECNAEAKLKKMTKAERQKFMSECLKG